MARVHLIIGPVGAGKSTLAAGLSIEHAAPRFTLDAWMARLFGDDARPPDGVIAWYLERRDRCLATIWDLVSECLELNISVVLEIGLLVRSEREDVYARLSPLDHELTVYVVDAPRDIRRARVERRNAEQGVTFSMVVPPEIFEMASDRWQSPEPDECSGRDVRFL